MAGRGSSLFPVDKFDVGDVEIIHPQCRTKILITDFALRVGNGRASIYVEGICNKCGRYVRLQMRKTGLEDAIT